MKYLYALILLLFSTQAFAVSPTTPTNLQAVNPISGSAVYLIWEPSPDTDFASFNIYRKIQGGSYTTALANVTLASAAAAHRSITTYLVSASTAVTYCYVIKSVNGSAAESAASNEVCYAFSGGAVRGLRGGGASPGNYVLNETGGKITIEAGSGFILKE